MKPFALTTIILAGTMASAAHAGLVSDWIGGASGNWNVSGNWNNGVPGSVGVTDAVITTRRGAVSVALTTSPSISTLTIGANCSLNQADNADIALTGGLTNDGTWTLNSVGNGTDIILNAVTVPFQGSGTLSMSGNTQNRIFGANAVRTLLNDSGHTIRGAGRIGMNTNLDVVNNGIIRADFATPINIDASNTVTNAGLLVASNGGVLNLLTSAYGNTGGVIRADDGGTVTLQGAAISGGELETQGTGTIALTTTISTFDGVHIADTLTQPDNADVVLASSITNDGVWSMNSVGNGTDVIVNAAIVALDGSGSIAMSNNTQNRFFGANELRVLVNGANHTIHGGGQIGQNNNLDLTNEGTIRADTPSTLTLDLSNVCTNDGLLVASDGGTMVLLNCGFVNTNGVIRAEDASVVSLQGVAISGGELETQGSGSIKLTTNISTFNGVHIADTLTQPDNADMVLASSITNDGVWSMNSVGNGTDVIVNAAIVALDGSGSIAMSNNTQNRFFGANELRVLVNGANHTIHGGGQIGQNNNLDLTNEGTIRADTPSTLTLDLSNVCTNDGLLVASDGGTMVLLNCGFVNTNGVIRAEDASVVSLQGVAISGGELETQGSGSIKLTTNPSTFDGVRIADTLTQPDNADVVLASSITNDGVWSMNSVGNGTDVIVNAAIVALDGSGSMVMSSNTQNRIFGANALRTLVNGLQHTIRGAGQLGQNNNLDLTNKGTIIADGTTALSIDVSTIFNNESTGTLRVSGSGGLSLLAGTFNNYGLFEIDAGRLASRTGSMSQLDGETRVNGTLTLTAGSTVSVTGGLLSGNGVLNGKADVTGGSLAPSSTTSDIADIGTLTINGSYTQSLVGGYLVDVGLSGNDLTVVNGTAQLGGALQVRLVDGFFPIAGQSFTIMMATSITGTFGCIEYPSIPAGYFHAVYHPTFVELIVDLVPGVEADLNHDGVVNAADLAILLGNWGLTPCGGATCCESDLNGDGQVNGADLAILLGAWS